ncbi:MAG: hypothetical protein IJ404_04555 [Clostridia bacterium]|nr:hypothetical protein [Clostridia bacterium]
MVKHRSLFGYASLVFIFFYIVFSDIAARSALNGMKLCGKVLVPTLFPMMILTGIAVRSGVFNTLSRIGNKLFTPLFGICGKYIASFLIGILGSAPTGAMAVKNLSCEKESDSEKASALLLSSVVSFGFIYSVVGINILGSTRRGVALFFFQIVSVMLTAVFLRPKKSHFVKTKLTSMKSEKLSNAVASSIRDAAINMLSVCGSVIFFSSLSGIIVSLPIKENIKLFICPFLELASGLQYISGKFPPDVTFILVSSAIGWSGLSMIFQSLSVSEGKIPSHKYILGRVVSALICPILAFISINLGII